MTRKERVEWAEGAYVEHVAAISTEDPSAGIERRELVAALETALRRLPTRYEKIIRKRFGIDTGEVVLVRDIGDEFEVTPERVRQIAKEALRRLRGDKQLRAAL